MELTLRDGLLFVSIAIVHNSRSCIVPDVIVDTGSATTMLSSDHVAAISIVPKPKDVLYTIRGIGGIEVVFSRCFNHIWIGLYTVDDFDVEIGGMDYGFSINGILGMDFLLKTGAVIDLNRLELTFTALH